MHLIVFATDVEYLLMPLKFPRTASLEDFVSLQRSIQNDQYKAAVKHLHDALHSTPPALEALLPLIQASDIFLFIKINYFERTDLSFKFCKSMSQFWQILLLGDQVKEAIEEVESAVQNTHASLPFR